MPCQSRVGNVVGSTDEFEREARRCGYRRIAGLDEAGRGPLAGPVVAAAVILPCRCRLDCVDDSKQLSESEREDCYIAITRRAIAVGVGSASHEEIDRLNVLEATRLAMQRAVASLSPSPDCLLIDAVVLPACGLPARSIIKGDALCLSISAASIVAKVTRDRLMADYHRLYPEYNFESHKGYGTEDHVRRLSLHGPCAIHRRTFAPVAHILGYADVPSAPHFPQDSEWFGEIS